jgi:adenosylhomocysteinase
MESIIKDITLAPAGQLKIDWVRAHMPVLNTIEKDFVERKPFSGKRVAICLHLEAKTAYMALVIAAGGAEVAVAGSNPLSTQDDVVAALVKNGITAFAHHGATSEEYTNYLRKLADFNPDLFIDDGGDFTALLHREYPDLLSHVLGGCEETTTGIIRLHSMDKDKALHIPMMAVNNGMMKHLFDNRYGTGQSAWEAVMNSTNLVISSKVVVIVGYGWCGKGAAMRARGMGGRVIVTEVDPVKAIEAVMDGFDVMPIREAAKVGDIFITVTGNLHVIDDAAFEVMKDRAILANAGHFDVEINKKALEARAVEIFEARKNITGYRMADGRTFYLIAEGRLVNLAAGDGHPAEIMDLTFGLQIKCLEHLLAGELPAGVHDVPAEIDDAVAHLKLSSLGKSIDILTEEQKDYLNSWAL